MTSLGTPEPSFDSIVSEYDAIVQKLYCKMSALACKLLIALAKYLCVDPSALLDLTDCRQEGRLLSDKEGTCRLSSSLLRICSYPQPTSDLSSSQKTVQFGAHTDTSLLTLAMHSSTPGLEVYDPVVHAYVCPEQLYLNHGTKQSMVTIFVGEFLQVLTKHNFRACVHRVRVDNNTSRDGRLSCPFIIRCLDSATLYLQESLVDQHGLQRRAMYLAKLDGVRMQAIHSLLDFKRQKCFAMRIKGVEDDKEEDEEWILSAFGATLD
jgi:isopenicillin N synthase-like dioxygenase